MRSTPLINARSASVPRFSGRYPASISFTISFTTASAPEPAAVGALRRTDGSTDPPVCPESRLVLLTGSLRRTTMSDNWPPRAEARHRGQRRRQTNDLRSGAVCTSARVVYRSRNIGEAQSPSAIEFWDSPRSNLQDRHVQANHRANHRPYSPIHRGGSGSGRPNRTGSDPLRLSGDSRGGARSGTVGTSSAGYRFRCDDQPVAAAARRRAVRR